MKSPGLSVSAEVALFALPPECDSLLIYLNPDEPVLPSELIHFSPAELESPGITTLDRFALAALDRALNNPADISPKPWQSQTSIDVAQQRATVGYVAVTRQAAVNARLTAVRLDQLPANMSPLQQKVVTDGLDALRQKTYWPRVTFNPELEYARKALQILGRLLPDEFILPELKTALETIHDQQLDRANFFHAVRRLQLRPVEGVRRKMPGRRYSQPVQVWRMPI